MQGEKTTAKRWIKFLLVLIFVAAVAACGGGGGTDNGEERGGGSSSSGGSSGSPSGNTHQAGVDCTSCHTSGWKPLLIGGTVFAGPVSGNVCGGAHVQFLNAANAVAYDSANYSNSDSVSVAEDGGSNLGNVYIRQKNLSAITPGTYTMRVMSWDNVTLAQSGPHVFSGSVFAVADMNNRYSCNSCHKTGGLAGLQMYVQQNSNKCQ